MEIKIEDYLSQEEMTKIAKEEFNRMLMDDRTKERLLTNMSYNLGYGFVRELITDEDLELLKQKTKENLNSKTALNMFVYDKPDAWGHKPKDDLIVYNEVQKTIKENINIVRANVIEALQNLDLDNFSEEFDLSTIFSVLISSLQNKIKD
ncbi:MAG: hypothetical protein WCX83_00330 [Candidatus Cloacimonas sp.]